MKNIVREARRIGDVMMHFCSGTCFTAKECLWHDLRRMKVACDMDFELLITPEADSMVTLVFQVLSPKSDISGSAKIQTGAKVLERRWGCILGQQEGLCVESPVRLGRFPRIAPPHTALHLKEV